MAEAADKDSKTEEATEKKIRDTIEKGQLPHSQEAPILASFVAILVFAVFFAGDSDRRARHLPVDLPREAGRLAARHGAATSIELYSVRLHRDRQGAGRHADAARWSPASAPRCCRTCRNSSASASGRRLSRISIGEGWKRLFGVQGFVEFLKSLGKLGFAVAGPGLHAVSESHHRLLLRHDHASPAAFGLVIREHRHRHPGRRSSSSWR